MSLDRASSSWSGFAIAFALLLLSTLVHPAATEAAITGCSVSSSGIVFSPYDSQTKAAVDGAGTISVTCTGSGTTNTVSLTLTGGNGGTCTGRRMTSGANNLTYQVYRNAGRSNAFCDGSNRLTFNISFAAGSPQTVVQTMYGRVTAAQNPVYSPSYTDSLAVTLRSGTTGPVLATTTAPISGSVAPICTVTAGTLGFGSYVQTAASLSTALVTVNCSNGAPYQIGLGGGLNLLGTTRRMAGPGAERLSYELYSDSGRTIAWGDGGALGARVAVTGNGANQARTVYGRIPAGQAPAPGSYADTVVVTVEY